jgi:hypothetical protein
LITLNPLEVVSTFCHWSMNLCHTENGEKFSRGSFYSWPDGELVTPDKLAGWLKEDIPL